MGDHKGNLRSKLAEINATFGISDQWNMSVDMMLGNRSMDYYRVENIHHRDEHKLGLGDTRVTLRYLFENTTFGPGPRMFLGSGLIIPSKNTLQDDPFLMGRNGQRHTHFDLGEGVYKGLLEFQYFNRTQGSIYPGGFLKVVFPLQTNQYGYKPGLQMSSVFIGYLQTKSLFRGVPFVQIIGQYRSVDTWSGLIAPNSEGGVINIGVGLSWSWAGNYLTLSVRGPVYITTSVAGQEQDKVQSRTDAWGFSFSIRKSFTLPKFSPEQIDGEEHDHEH